MLLRPIGATHLRASFAAAQRQSAIAMAGNRRNNNCRLSFRQMEAHPLKDDPRCAGRLLLRLWLANSYSRRHWCFVQAATMLLPAIGLEVEAAGFRRFYRSLPFQRLVSSVAVEIGLENGQFRF